MRYIPASVFSVKLPLVTVYNLKYYNPSIGSWISCRILSAIYYSYFINIEVYKSNKSIYESKTVFLSSLVTSLPSEPVPRDISLILSLPLMNLAI